MSGETEDKPSAWQVDSLHSHLLALLNAERDYTDGRVETILQRLDDMDKATVVLNDTLTRMPTDLQQVETRILRLMDERDRRVEEHFGAIRRLGESETTLNQKALDAALATSKEATAVSSASLDRTIGKNAQLADQAVQSLAARVTQVGDQVILTTKSIAEILASKQAVVEQKTDTRGNAGMIWGIVGGVIGILSFVMAAILAATRLAG